MVMGEVKKTFNPEFINRVDEIIVFDALNDDDLRQIVLLLANQMNEVLRDKKLQVSLTQDAVDWIIESTCQDRSYGARPLRRALQKYVEDPLSEALIQGSLPRPSELEVYLGDTGIYYRVIQQPEAEQLVGAESSPVTPAPGVPLYNF
jgi:ATP-dependent Clp protease ATP-binding subunit ClpC